MEIDKRLLDILSLRRPSGSVGERLLIEKHILPTGAVEDEFGNLILRIGTAPVLWSCHTDTVHKEDGVRQKLLILEDEAKVTSDNSSCLGGDNGAGVWLCLELIKHNVEGLYIFHRQEEIGGKGSFYIQEKTPHILDGITHAVAFDRRETGSIITHQITRTASDAFANALADSLGMGHRADDSGTFTDTANYAHIIPECTNVSAGFYNEHTMKEWQDCAYLMALRDKLLTVDVSSLPVVRNVNDTEYAGGIEAYYQGLVKDYQYVGANLIWSYPLETYKFLSSLGLADEVIEHLRWYESQIAY